MHTVCDVCRLLDGDYSVKFCTWCLRCQAWICQADEHRPDRRLRAAYLRLMGVRQGEVIG